MGWINSTWLEVNLETAEVRFRRRPLKAKLAGQQRWGTRWILQFRAWGHRRTIVRSKLVWMAKERRILPPDWEVHHKDEDRYNDVASNLEAMHKDDHLKLHHGEGSDDPWAE